jgi:crossover junction endodeoxyribonuclease RuvC
MAFLGIDPSLTAFALQLSTGGRTTGHQINTVPKDFASFPERLNFITQEFSRFLSENPGISLAAIEGFSMGSARSGLTQIMISAVGASARLELWRAGIDYIEVPPSTLKKWISGKGNAEKNLMLREVFKRWGYDAKDDNDADAFALVKLAERWRSVVQETKTAAELWRSIANACEITEGRALAG